VKLSRKMGPWASVPSKERERRRRITPNFVRPSTRTQKDRYKLPKQRCEEIVIDTNLYGRKRRKQRGRRREDGLLLHL
jgi:hypothetical protein